MAKGHRIVAIGPAAEMAFLRAAGVQIVPMERGGNPVEEVRRLAGDASVCLVLISETLVEDRLDVLAQIHQTGAVTLVVPPARGSRDTTLAFMKRFVEQSIGVDLISKG